MRLDSQSTRLLACLTACSFSRHGSTNDSETSYPLSPRIALFRLGRNDQSHLTHVAGHDSHALRLNVTDHHFMTTIRADDTRIVIVTCPIRKIDALDISIRVFQSHCAISANNLLSVLWLRFVFDDFHGVTIMAIIM